MDYNKIIKFCENLDKQGLYKQADMVEQYIKTAQNVTYQRPDLENTESYNPQYQFGNRDDTTQSNAFNQAMYNYTGTALNNVLKTIAINPQYKYIISQPNMGGHLKNLVINSVVNHAIQNKQSQQFITALQNELSQLQPTQLLQTINTMIPETQYGVGTRIIQPSENYGSVPATVTTPIPSTPQNVAPKIPANPDASFLQQIKTLRRLPRGTSAVVGGQPSTLLRGAPSGTLYYYNPTNGSINTATTDSSGFPIALNPVL